MTAHQLARKLLSGPDLPVVINGWSSDEGFAYEVDDADEDSLSFKSDGSQPKDHLGYELPRDCITLGYDVKV